MQMLHSQFIATTKPQEQRNGNLGKEKGIFMDMLLPVLWGCLPFPNIRGKGKEEAERASILQTAGVGLEGKIWGKKVDFSVC